MSFRQIKGQDKQIEILKLVWGENRLPCAYLFTGPAGIGKSMVAKTFAKLINCLDNKSQDSCDSCASCIKIDNGNHPDVHWLSATDSIKIEDIRQLQNDISLRPYEARIKTFIINDAENLTPEAANAFLKILEEPPKNSLIILITSKPQLLPATILSRCQKLKFPPLQKDLLKELLNKEYGLDNVLSHYLAYFCEGRLGDALNLKNKDLLLNKNRIIDYFTLPPRSRGGFSDSRSNNLDVEFNKNRIKEILGILISWFRDIYFIKIGMPHMQLINIDRKNGLIDSMNLYSLSELDLIFGFIAKSASYLENNINPKLLLSNLRATITTHQNISARS